MKQRDFAAANGATMLLVAMHTFPADPGVQATACEALRVMSAGEQLRSRLVATRSGAIKRVVAALKMTAKHIHHWRCKSQAKVMSEGPEPNTEFIVVSVRAHALAALVALTDKRNTAAIGAAAIPSVLAAMRAHKDTHAIQRHACHLLHRLTLFKAGKPNIARLASRGGVAALIAALESFPLDSYGCVDMVGPDGQYKQMLHDGQVRLFGE